MPDANPNQVHGQVSHQEISAADAGQRLDNYLMRVLKGVPRSHVYRLLRSGQVRVNSGRAKPLYKLKVGDRVRIPPVRRAESDQQTPPAGMVEQVREAIIHEDKHLLVLDKPAGMAVHGGSGVRFGVIEALRASGRDAERLELVHRIDRETSGCLVCAKNLDTLRELHAQLRDGGFDKEYLCLVAGRWNDAITLRHELDRAKRGGERVVRVEEEGQTAVSHFSPLEHYDDDATLMRVKIETGRTHQIRVQAAEFGHPLAADRKYGDRDFNRWCRARGLQRLFLHAQSVAFTTRSGPQHFSAPLPADLGDFLETL